MVIDDRNITFSEFNLPSNIPWNRLGVDVVIESSGSFWSIDQLLRHLDNGAKKVIVSAPVKEDVLNIVMVVNNHQD